MHHQGAGGDSKVALLVASSASPDTSLSVLIQVMGGQCTAGRSLCCPTTDGNAPWWSPGELALVGSSQVRCTNLPALASPGHGALRPVWGSGPVPAGRPHTVHM